MKALRQKASSANAAERAEAILRIRELGRDHFLHQGGGHVLTLDS